MDAAGPHHYASRFDRVHPWVFALFLALAAIVETLGQTGPRVVPIGLVQGPVPDDVDPILHASPLSDQRVTVQGVVTQRIIRPDRDGRVEVGFFVQNTTAVADGDETTSDAILVVAGKNAHIPTTSPARYLPRIGHEIVLEGKVRERAGMTQLTSCRLVQVVRTDVDVHESLEPVSWPRPVSIADAHRFWERHEAMQVAAPPGCLALGGRKVFDPYRDGECWIQAPPFPETDRSHSPYARRVFRDAHPLDDLPESLFDNGNPNRVCLGSLGIKGAANDPMALIGPARTFDRIQNAFSGAVYQRYESYSVQPSAAPAFTPGIDPSANGIRPAAPLSSHFTVATFNLQNLFDIRDDPGDPCDAPDDLGNHRVPPPFNYLPANEGAYRRRLDELATQIAVLLGGPDIVMVQEVEDQDLTSGPSWNGAFISMGPDGRPDVLEDLAAAVRAQRGPAYRVAADRDGAGYRGLLCAFLYRADRMVLDPPSADHPILGSLPKLSYRGAPLPMVHDVQNPKAFNAQLPADVDLSTGMADTNVFARAVQVAWFQVIAQGGSGDSPLSLYVLNNHFSSRPNQRVGQRIEQARYNAALVEAIRRAEPEACILVGGDLNVFPRPDDPFGNPASDQLSPLYEAGLFNAYDHLIEVSPQNAYTYVYQGQAGSLDQIFLSGALTARLHAVWAGHFNSDWPEGHLADRPFGASDHDPLLATFTLNRAPATSPIGRKQ